MRPVHKRLEFIHLIDMLKFVSHAVEQISMWLLMFLLELSIGLIIGMMLC